MESVLPSSADTTSGSRSDAGFFAGNLVPAGAGVLAMVAGILVLLGWALDLDVLKQIVPGFASMNPVTGLCFILAGVSLWGWSYGTAQGSGGRRSLSSVRALAKLSGGVVLGFGLAMVGHYFFGWEIGAAQFLFEEKLAQERTEFPNQMAPNTAVGFVLLGAALLLVNRTTRRGTRPSEWLALGVGLISSLALIGYLYKIQALFSVGLFIPMALHTAGLFLILAVGVFSVQPGAGLMKIVVSDSSGGLLLRRLFPGMVAALALLGWLRLEGQRHGLYSEEVGVTLFAIANIAVFTGLIGWSARSLNVADAERDYMKAERERFFTLSPDLLGIASWDGYFKRVNPAFSRTLGHSADAMLAQPFLDYVHPDDRESTLAEFEELKKGETNRRFVNRYRCRNGSWKWLSWKVQTFQEKNLLYASARDVTEDMGKEAAIKELNDELHVRAAELEVANQELESFSYSVSHDLRAPLRHIHGYVEMLTKATEGQLDEKPKRYLRTISEASAEMGHLIDDLLTFSRMGRIEMAEGAVSLDQLVAESIHGLEVATQGREIDWIVPDLPVVIGDRAMLRQVFSNLLGNAVKYTRDRAPARIEIGTAGEASGRVTFFVRDNGAGFDMQYVHKLFGVFQRLHRSDEFEGTGIGLANVRRIISRHGGETWAEGELGKGATLFFTLRTEKNSEDQA